MQRNAAASRPEAVEGSQIPSAATYICYLLDLGGEKECIEPVEGSVRALPPRHSSGKLRIRDLQMVPFDAANCCTRVLTSAAVRPE
jgi:hypothetical protein